MGVGTSSIKACAVYSDMNKLRDDINNGLWKESEYAIIYIEKLAYIYTVDGFASSMDTDDYDIKDSTNITHKAKKTYLNNGLNKVNCAYLDEWFKNSFKPAPPIHTLNYFAFSALEDSNISLSSNIIGNNTNELYESIVLEYSKDKTSWELWNYNHTPIYLQANETVYIRGNNPHGLGNMNTETGIGIAYSFSNSTGKFNVHGNIMSLLYNDDFSDKICIPTPYCFYELFTSCNIISAADLILPATILTERCYGNMFANCSNLLGVPELPAITLQNMCYSGMFMNCLKLMNVPELPATTLADYCYSFMFYGCESLLNTPELLASTLADGCYLEMFGSCVNLINAPKLSASILKNECYSGMFNGCINLTNAPDLPAPNLVYNCYSYMFYGCTNLNYIKIMATNADTNINECTDSWTHNVSSNGIFVKHPNMTLFVKGEDGIPNGWTVNNSY